MAVMINNGRFDRHLSPEEQGITWEEYWKLNGDGSKYVNGVEVYINLGEYVRPYNDPDRGSVTNVGTYNSSYTAISGADGSGAPTSWVDISDEQAVAFAALAKVQGYRCVAIRKMSDRIKIEMF